MIRFYLGLIFAFTLLSACSAPTSQTKLNPVTPPDYNSAPLDLSTPEHAAYFTMIPNGLPRWRDRVATFEIGQVHEELFDIKVERFGTLASVWAPFVIRVEGQLVGCGVNQFTMAQMDTGWRIVSGIDVQAPKEDCETFRENYKSGS